MSSAFTGGGKLAPLAADARKHVSFACQGATSLRTGRCADGHVSSDTCRSVVAARAATFPFSGEKTQVSDIFNVEILH